jgi:hypothetical protein
MISRAFLLHHISGFQNRKNIIVEDQSTGDIIKAILDTHPKYKDDYKKTGVLKGPNEIMSDPKSKSEYISFMNEK